MEMTLRRYSSGTQQAATWLFVLSFLTLGVGRDHAYVEWAGLALLAFASFVLFRQPVPVRAIRRIILSGAVLVLVVCAYLIDGYELFGVLGRKNHIVDDLFLGQVSRLHRLEPGAPTMSRRSTLW